MSFFDLLFEKEDKISNFEKLKGICEEKFYFQQFEIIEVCCLNTKSSYEIFKISQHINFLVLMGLKK